MITAATYFALTDEGKAAIARDKRGLPLGYWLWSPEDTARYYRENPRTPNAGPPGDRQDRAAWLEYRKWEEREIAVGRLDGSLESR